MKKYYSDISAKWHCGRHSLIWNKELVSIKENLVNHDIRMISGQWFYRRIAQNYW